MNWWPSADAWIATVTVATVIGMLSWLMRNLILTRLTKAVSFEFDKKLEILRSEISRKQNQIDALQGGALSAQLSRRNSLFEKRVKAVEQIWEAVTNLSAAKGLARTLLAIKFDSALEKAEKDDKARELFRTMGGNIGPLRQECVSASRIFASPLAWALYEAYKAILVHSFLRFELLKQGLNQQDIIDTDGVMNVVAAVLPEMADAIRKNGPEALPTLIETLEERLVDALRLMLDNEEDDQRALASAKRITDAVMKFTDQSGHK